MTSFEYAQGVRAFIPGWTNHSEHNPYQKGSKEWEDFRDGWNSQADTCEYGLDIE